MDREAYLELRLNAAMDSSKGILDGSVDAIVAIRNIVSIGSDFPKIVEFLPFSYFDSETDGCHRDPAIRSRYGKALLHRLDTEADVFLQSEKKNLESACRDLIKAISPSLPTALESLEKSNESIERDFFSLENLEAVEWSFIYGIVDKEDIVEWADSEIEKAHKPDYLFIDLSASINLGVKDIASLISKRATKELTRDSVESIFKVIASKTVAKRIPLKVAIDALGHLCYSEKLLSAWERAAIHCLDYANDEADEGWITSDEVKKALLGFLKKEETIEMGKCFKCPSKYYWKTEVVPSNKKAWLPPMISKIFLQVQRLWRHR